MLETKYSIATLVPLSEEGFCAVPERTVLSEILTILTCPAFEASVVCVLLAIVTPYSARKASISD